MCVDIDPPGGDQLAFCVDLVGGWTCDLPDFGDLAILYRDISNKTVVSRSIDNSAVSNDRVIHRVHSLVSGLKIATISDRSHLMRSSIAMMARLRT
jgi:hypothetical protein